MALAMSYPGGKTGGRRERGKTLVTIGGFSPQTLHEARVVLRHSRPLAERVLDGSISLYKAFNEVRPPPARPPKPKKIPVLKAKASPRHDFLMSIRTGSKYW